VSAVRRQRAPTVALKHGPLFALVGAGNALLAGDSAKTLPALESQRVVARRLAADRHAMAVPVKIVYDAAAAAAIARAKAVWLGAVAKAEVKLRAAGWHSWGGDERREWTRADGIGCTLSFDSGDIVFWRSQAGFPARVPVARAALGTRDANVLIRRMARRGKDGAR